MSEFSVLLTEGGNAMPVSKAQQEAVNKYMKENYDRFLLTLRPKGRLETIKVHAAVCGESTSAFINRAISETSDRDGKSFLLFFPIQIARPCTMLQAENADTLQYSGFADNYAHDFKLQIPPAA